MYASCDVGKQFNREEGILDPEMYDYESLLGVKLDMDKKPVSSPVRAVLPTP